MSNAFRAVARLSPGQPQRIWLRDPDRAVALLRTRDGTDADGEALSLLSWLVLTRQRDSERAEQLARAALERGGDTRFATAALAEVLLRRGDGDEAIAVVLAERERWPALKWYELTLADAYVEAGRPDEAKAVLEAAARDDDLRRHALKRLSRLALEGDDREAALELFQKLVELAPNYLVYASDYVTLGELRLEAGEPERAREVWRKGARTYPRNAALRALRAEHFGEEEPLAVPRVPAVAEETVGARRIPIRTPLISGRTGLLPVVDEATRDLRAPGDVIAVAESAAAAGQGRIVPLELVRPGRLARILSGFVGEIGPLHSPEGMHGAIMEAGRARVALAALAGGIGKLFRRRGWFYRVAGPHAAMIDDVAACLPPHDHHLIFGPAEPDELAASLAGDLGCEVAIVDANHLTGAWIVGASPGVDRHWLTEALDDNPAGNEDEQTPIVLVRPGPGVREALSA